MSQLFDNGCGLRVEAYVEELLKRLVGPSLAVNSPLCDGVIGRVDAVGLGPLEKRIKD